MYTNIKAGIIYHTYVCCNVIRWSKHDSSAGTYSIISSNHVTNAYVVFFLSVLENQQCPSASCFFVNKAGTWEKEICRVDRSRVLIPTFIYRLTDTQNTLTPRQLGRGLFCLGVIPSSVMVEVYRENQSLILCKGDDGWSGGSEIFGKASQNDTRWLPALWPVTDTT